MLDMNPPRVSVTFSIPGKPFGKKRARGFYNKKLGRAVTVNDADNRSFEDIVRGIALTHFPSPLVGPVRLTIVATFAPAKSWSQKKRDASYGRHHTQTPDTDNVVKAVSDGLNRVAWGDDGQVAELHARKQWGTCDGTLVTVEALG